MELFYNILIYSSSIFFLAYVFVFFFLYKGIGNLNYKISDWQPSVSIVVSLHNEEANAEQLINCLVNQNYPKEKLEIILINDRSTDNTLEILYNCQKKYPHVEIIPINDLKEDFAPKKRAIDLGIRQAKGEIILLTDADGRPEANWASKMVSLFSEETGMVIGYAPYSIEKYSQRLLALEYFSHATIASATTGLNFPLTCVGTNIAYRKKVYLELDGFDYYFHSMLKGHDTEYFPDGENVNPREDFKYSDANSAIDQPEFLPSFMIGVNYNF